MLFLPTLQANDTVSSGRHREAAFAEKLTNRDKKSRKRVLFMFSTENADGIELKNIVVLQLKKQATAFDFAGFKRDTLIFIA